VLENYYQLDYGYHHSHRQQFDYLGLGNLAKQITFLFDTPLGLRNGVDHAADVIKNASRNTGRLPVLCLDSNPCDANQLAKKLGEQVDPKTFFVFHPDIRAEVSQSSNVAPWPSWLCNQQQLPNFQSGQRKKYRISFLSGVARYHRIRLMNEVRPWIRDNDVIVINRFAPNMLINTIPNSLVHTVPELLANLPYSNKAEFIDNAQCAGQEPDQADLQAHNSHAAYAARVNITGETTGGDQVLFSEKTWKSYISGCLTINFGIDTAPTVLKKFGIGIWEEYDPSVLWEQKIDIIKSLFQRDDIDVIYEKLTPMIQHNQNLVSSKDFAKMLAAPAIEKISNLLESR
jgi:hypothetical protein